MARRPSLELDHLSTLDRVSTFPIRTFGDPVLNSPASEVTEIDDALRRLVDGMVQTMYEAPGVGLAAPQVRVLVYSEAPSTDFLISSLDIVRLRPAPVSKSAAVR